MAAKHDIYAVEEAPTAGGNRRYLEHGYRAGQGLGGDTGKISLIPRMKPARQECEKTNQKQRTAEYDSNGFGVELEKLSPVHWL